MHSFKRIRDVIFTCAVVAAVLWGLDMTLYPCTFMRNDIHTVVTKQRDVIILGTSNGKMDIDPAILLQKTGYTGHNLCVGGEYPEDAYYMAKLLIERQHPQKIIYDISPEYLTTEKEKGNNYLLFYHEFPLSKAKLQYAADIMPDSDFRALFFPFYEYPLSYEFGKARDTVKQKITGNYDVSYLKGKVQEYHENGFIEDYPVEEKNFPPYSGVPFFKDKVKKKNMEYLKKLIALCKKDNIEFTAVSLPQPSVILSRYPDDFREAWDYLTDFLSKQDVTYYNFNREYYKAFSHDTVNYVDYNGHMNGDAARDFSRVLGTVLFPETGEAEDTAVQ